MASPDAQDEAHRLGGSDGRDPPGRPCSISEMQNPTRRSKDKELGLKETGLPVPRHPQEILGSADKAVDGNCNGDRGHGSCIHTKHEAQVWGYVDLGHSYNISVAVVKNREDCCGELIGRVEVHVGDSLENQGRSNPLCGMILKTSPGSITTIYCNGKQGHYISVHLPGVNNLVLCELEAYST